MSEVPANIQVLVVEDGDEYITNLTTFVAEGIDYRQAKSGGQAVQMIAAAAPDVTYLDMRFDRTPVEELLGDMVQLTGRFNGDIGRARRFQQDNQGLQTVTLPAEEPVQVIDIGGGEYGEHVIEDPGKSAQAPELL